MAIRSIVAVDDSGIILKTITKVLEKKYEVHAFSSGMRALQYLKNRQPDLIILDIDMPEINGFEMLEKIKTMDNLKYVPVIFLTSNSDKSHVVKAITSGAKDYVVKPIDEGVLLQKVKSVLDETQALYSW